MPNWLLMAIIGGIAANGTTITNRFSLKDGADPTAYAWWFELLRLIIFLLILPFDWQFDASPRAFFSLVLVGLIEVAAVYAFMKMFSHTQLSVSILISRLRLIFAPLFAALFLGEILTPIQYAGITAVFAGALLSNGHTKSIRSDPGVRYSLAFAICAGFLSISMKSASAFASTPLVMIAMSIPSLFILPLLMKSPLIRLKDSFFSRIRLNALSTLFNTAAMYLYVNALRIGSVGAVFTTFNSMAIIGILAGIFFFGEKEHLPGKIAGTVISLLGIFLLA